MLNDSSETINNELIKIANNSMPIEQPKFASIKVIELSTGPKMGLDTQAGE